MEWNEEIDLSQRKYTSKLIVERTLKRGWKIAGFKTNPAVFLIYVPGRQQPVKVFSASPPQMMYPAVKIAKDKFITSQVLKSENQPVPEELLLELDEQATSQACKDFLRANTPLVVKPLDASHGKGITVNIDSEDKLTTAIEEAKQEAINGRVLLQKQLDGFDVRIVCINYEYVDSITRIPASVVGNGRNTTLELIVLANQSDERGENYKAKLNFINVEKAKQYLGDQKISETPLEGEEVHVIGVSNVGMGGVRKNIKNQIPEFLKDMAIQAAKILDLPVCGIDFMVKKIPEKNDSLEDLNPMIIEVNECPMLTMYDDLHSPEQNEVIDKYLDFVATY